MKSKRGLIRDYAAQAGREAGEPLHDTRIADSGKDAYRPKSAAETSRNMAAIRSTGNRTETALRKALHGRGLRYRKYAPDLPGKPDIVFPTQKIAIFVDGDYWHGRVLREQGMEGLEAMMKTENRGYWMQKFQRNVERDEYVNSALEEGGWLVLRFWESDLKKDLAAAIERITAALGQRGKSS